MVYAALKSALDGYVSDKWEPILAPKASPKEATMNKNSSSDCFENEKSEIIDFVHPSLAKSLFLSSHGNTYGASMTRGNVFYGN